MKGFGSLRITVKFILWFLFISLVPLLIAIYVSYTSSRAILEQEVRNNLLVVADNKAHQIETYFVRLKNDALSFASMSHVVDAIERLAASYAAPGPKSPEYRALGEELRPMFEYYRKSFGYDEIMLISADGDILFPAGGKNKSESLFAVALGGGSELADTFVRAKQSREEEVSRFTGDPQTQYACLIAVVPVFKAQGMVGAVAVRIGNSGISEFVKDYTGLGATGETIVATKIGEEAVFLTPVRFDPRAAFTRKITMGSSEGVDIQQSFSGKDGSGVFTDYRGQEVLSMWRYLPTFQLGIVVKMDTREIYASAKKLRGVLLKISLTLLALVVAAALFIARSVSRPIKELTAVSKTIAEGEFSARADVRARDEIGELAAAFNRMADSLVEAKANVEQKNTEVEEQKRLLEAANKELDGFVYTASHDLRAPLRGVDGLVTFLEQDYGYKLDAKGKDFLAKIRVSVSRMKQLIDDLLKLSRISRIKNPYEDVDMNELVKSVIARLEFDIKAHAVKMSVAGNFPTVYCDKIKMEEVFYNLINNAIKYSSKNTRQNPVVDVGYGEKTAAHEFYVKDNGIGIDQKYHQEIFGIFKRLHSQEEYEGTGAGLGIVKKIIEDHQGSIWVDSELGKGAAFYFTIPKGLKG